MAATRILVRAAAPGARAAKRPRAEQAREEMRNNPQHAALGGPSALEARAVGEPAAKDYDRRLSRWDDFCQQHRLPQHNDRAIEVALLEFFDWCFLAALPLDTGTMQISERPWCR